MFDDIVLDKLLTPPDYCTATSAVILTTSTQLSVSTSSISAASLARINLASFILSIATNGTATLMVAYKFW